jgi:DnaJ-class molecular chaperone
VSGNNFTLKNEPLKGGDIITPNFKKIIPGLGMKRGEKTGNLIINYQVNFPDKITEKQVETLKSIL